MSKAAAEVLQSATEPLTLAEIVQRIDHRTSSRPKSPQAAARSALFKNPLIKTLGGRPARYV